MSCFVGGSNQFLNCICSTFDLDCHSHKNSQYAHSWILEPDVRISHIAKLFVPNSAKSLPWLVIFPLEPKSRCNQCYLPCAFLLSHFPLKELSFLFADPLTAVCPCYETIWMQGHGVHLFYRFRGKEVIWLVLFNGSLSTQCFQLYCSCIIAIEQ